MAPLLKWPGGKSRELPAILEALPPRFDRLLDPFVGGGALLFAVPAAVPAAVNDASADLVDLYRRVQACDPPFLDRADALAGLWDGIGGLVDGHGAEVAAWFRARADVPPDEVATAAVGRLEALRTAVVSSVPASWPRLAALLDAGLVAHVAAKLGRMRAGERRRGLALADADVDRNLEGAVRAAVYTAVRTAYNDGRLAGEVSAAQACRFLFLREFAYASMFRFNRRGEFNVPYGGITYNRKSFADRVAHLRSPGVVDRLATTTLSCTDFAEFLDAADPGPDDVVFLDPPYDSDFSAYDRRGFGADDHRRLAATIQRLPCRFQLVIKDTPLVRRLYLDARWHVRAFDLTYGWTIKERNDRATTHLLVTDVDPDLAAAG